MSVSYNEPITFGKHGSVRALNSSGIDLSEDGSQSWTSSAVAELDVMLAPARQDVFIEIEASPFIVEGVIRVQQVFIYLDGLFVGFHNLRDYEVKTLTVRRSIIAVRPRRMSLVLPNATSPSALSLSEDMRELGICLSAIVFKTST